MGCRFDTISTMEQRLARYRQLKFRLATLGRKQPPDPESCLQPRPLPVRQWIKEPEIRHFHTVGSL